MSFKKEELRKGYTYFFSYLFLKLMYIHISINAHLIFRIPHIFQFAKLDNAKNIKDYSSVCQNDTKLRLPFSQYREE